MKILLASTPALGHLNPILYVGGVLAANGHEVLVTTSTAYADKVKAADLHFRPLLGQADLDTRNMDALFPERASLESAAQLRFDMERIFIDTIPDQFATLKEILKQFPADLIIGDYLFGGMMPFLLGATRERPRIAALGITGLALSRDDGAPFGPGIPPAQTPEELEQCRNMAAWVEQHVYCYVRTRLNTVLRSLGAKPVKDHFEASVTLPDLFLQGSVPCFEYPRNHLPKSVKFIGGLLAPSRKPLEENVRRQLETAVLQEQKVVLVTQGIVANDNFGQLLLPTLDTFAGDPDVFVIATTGGRDVQSINHNIPDNAIVCKHLPFDKVLPYVDVLVTNGGYGTVTQSLAAGVPMVVAGLTEDKPEVAARVAWAGVGINLRTSTPHPDAIRHAVETIIDDERFSQKAREFVADYARYDTVRELEMAIAGLLYMV